LKNAIVDESILKQVDKTFVLCIDPETRLPFMINMGLKTADTIDLDNRPSGQRHDRFTVRNNSGGFNEVEDIISSPTLDPRNYPFYYKIKRNLYIMEELLNDKNNS
jgi:hypothetical protein